MEKQINPKFEVLILGVIFDPVKKKILIGRKKNNPGVNDVVWYFPGGKAILGEDVDKTLKRNIKIKTGYNVKNLGTIFSQTYPEKEGLLGVYFLTQVFEGKEKVGDNFLELKWVSPKELDKYLTISFHKKLKEYLIDLV